MGDSAFLTRSFSHPSSAIRESKEGDPLRALTESISFGRFMSESLAWEKWSTFSHNRYLEEVEQFSKPGSVAQKKAYFEAHYKKRAAMKAAAMLEQASTAVNSVPEAEESESTTGNGDVDMNEPEKDATDPQLICSANVMPSYSDFRSDKLDNGNAESNAAITEQNAEIEKSTRLENSSHLLNDVGCEKVVSVPEEKMLDKDATEKDYGALPSNKQKINSSSKTADQSKASKIQRSPTGKFNSSKRKAGASADTNSKKSLGDCLNKEKSTPKAMHVSVNFTSSIRNTSKDHLRMPKDTIATVQNPTKKSIHGAHKVRQSMTQESTERRNISVVNKSFSGRILQSISSDASKMSGHKSRFSIISSPFSFKSEERAAKRKEFFQKLEEKNDKQREMMHQNVKAEHGLAKLRQSFRTKPNDDLSHGLQSPRNQIKKIPPTRPRSPKLGRKPPSSMVRETHARFAQRPTTNSESSRNVTVKSSRSMSRSVTQLPKKKVYENASPNIQS